MALKDKIAFGVSLPHRSPDPIDMADVRHVAVRAEQLGFRDLWVTENTLDHVMCFDPVVILTYAAAVTSKIRLGASVVVLQIHSPLMVAHQWACLDYVSGGRAILGVGIGRDHHYRQFEVSQDGRVSRFREELDIIRALWSEEKVTYQGRDPDDFPISKRVFMAVDERPEVARRELLRWFTDVYRNPPGVDICGIHGTPEQVRERLEEMVAMGANHLLLNPVSRYSEQVEALAEVVGLT